MIESLMRMVECIIIGANRRERRSLVQGSKFEVQSSIAHLPRGGYFDPMRVAFKEWAVIVDALARGEQIIILRKGGLREGPGGFQVEHPEFLFFPTLFHQQRDSVLPAAQQRFDEIAPNFPPPTILRLEYFGRVAAWQRLESLSAAEALRGQHIWRDEVIAERFDWGRDRAIHALAARVFRLPTAIDLPMLKSYGGCKSWIELEKEIDTNGAQPVLDEGAFSKKLERFTLAVRKLATGC
jgi:hypothetical protein